MEEKKWYDNIVVDWFKDTDKSRGVFSTLSAFVMSTGVYMFAQGITSGFEIKEMWNWGTFAVGFAGSLGVPAVQEDGMAKGLIKFLKNTLFIKYREENIELSDKLYNRDYRRHFVNNINDKNVSQLVEEATEKRIGDLKDTIVRINNGLVIESKSKKIKKLKSKLQQTITELAHVEEEGLSRNDIHYENIEIDDVFNFVTKKETVGKQSLTDSSTKSQRKSNWIARFYMPALSIIIVAAAKRLLDVDIGSLIGATSIFLLILIFTWYKSYSKRIELKESSAIPSERNRNTLLKQADEEYSTWKLEKDNPQPPPNIIKIEKTPN